VVPAFRIGLNYLEHNLIMHEQDRPGVDQLGVDPNQRSMAASAQGVAAERPLEL
jgi:hypothetical protein